MNGKIIDCMRRQLGACSLRKVHVFSDSVFCTDPGSLDSTSASNKWNNGRTSHEKGTLARTQAILRGRRLKLNGTHFLETHRCRYCNIYKFSCRRPGTYPRVFQTESFLRARSTTSPTTQVKRCKESVWTARKKWLLTQQDSVLVIAVSVDQDRNRPGITTSQDLLFNGLTESKTILLLR